MPSSLDRASKKKVSKEGFSIEATVPLAVQWYTLGLVLLCDRGPQNCHSNTESGIQGDEDSFNSYCFYPFPNHISRDFSYLGV